jgi:25S rRNA (uracil2843-N3)-methyltransferase
LVEWVGIDYGPWTNVLDKFNKSLSDLWSLELKTSEHQMNLLDTPTPEALVPLLQGDTKLVTILFTICELMSQSRPSTIRLLHTLTQHLAPGGYLLVADSASDIAEFELGASGRKWPIYMVLDAVLLGMKDETNEGRGQWRKVDGVDSRWFRLGEGVGEGWPVKLENTRYWYRLYKRV